MQTSKLIVTETPERPSKRYVNMNLFEQLADKSHIKVDIVKWLVTKKIPKTKDSDNVLVVLIHRSNSWQICGICNKKGAAPSPNIPLKHMEEEKGSFFPPGSTIVEDNGCCEGGLFTHKDINNKVRYVTLHSDFLVNYYYILFFLRPQFNSNFTQLYASIRICQHGDTRGF